MTLFWYVLFQVRERLRVALERNSQLEEELSTANQEVKMFEVFYLDPSWEASSLSIRLLIVSGW